MARNTRKEKEKVFKRRIHLPLQWQEVIGVKGKDYNKEMKLQFQAIWVSGSTLHLFCSFATLVALLCNLCMHRLFKKMKHAEKSIANCSHSIKCCIDRDQGLLQAKHGMKMTGWKGHQENMSSQTIFIGNSLLYTQNVHIQGPRIILHQVISIIVFIQRKRKRLPRS